MKLDLRRALESPIDNAASRPDAEGHHWPAVSVVWARAGREDRRGAATEKGVCPHANVAEVRTDGSHMQI